MNRFLQSFFSLDSLLKPTNLGAAFAGTIIGPILTEAFGSGKFWAFLLFFAIIVADWITGMAAAKKDVTYSSEYGISGALRTLLMLWIPFIGWLLDKVSLTVFGINQPGYAFFAITIMLSYHTWESMTANAYRAGWEKWIPKSVTSFVSSEIKAKTERAQKQKDGTSK
ncbi:phage holin family protein [Paenibacillus anseongense]|uniref:phage holin family protein n=1 Tax=Paenibacillus anseongense TaxID=2682845 RepID=UPI002DBD8CC0|nr:phage holin family protein [Paenibacillus anseongense]MEC0269045.1 phage holin family protein [Paenibacillus anseongense]